MREREDIFLSAKEARRVFVMEEVVEGRITVREAAAYLNLSERQVKRLKKGMKERGVLALVHGNRGRTPKHAISKDIKDMVALLAQNEYKGASCQHMPELLAEQKGIHISSKSVSRILKERGILNPYSHKSCTPRKSRTRAPKEGMLVQLDASPFDWFEGRGPKLELHGAIDDATSKVLALYFRPNEDLRGYLEVLERMTADYGIPRAVYTDGHTIFFSPKKDKLTIEEELAGKQVALTQLGRVFEELGISHIHARSPQAKGRIERLWGTLQGRLKIEMRIEGISSIEEANEFLPGFIEKYNKQFAVEPADPESAFAAPMAKGKMESIICLREERTATGSTISYYGQKYQLVDEKGNILPLPSKSVIQVLRHLDDSIDAMYRGKRYGLCEFNPAPKPEIKLEAREKQQVSRKPNPDNPWLNFKLPPKVDDPVEQYFEKRNWRLRQIHQNYKED